MCKINPYDFKKAACLNLNMVPQHMAIFGKGLYEVRKLKQDLRCAAYPVWEPCPHTKMQVRQRTAEISPWLQGGAWGTSCPHGAHKEPTLQAS